MARAFWSTHKRVILFASFLGILIANFVPRLMQLVKRSQPVRIGLVGKYTFETLPSEILGRISQGLTEIAADGSITPGLASSWEVLNDGRRYRFFLKNDIFWHNKEEIVSENVNYNFTDVSIARIDKKTLEFELKESFSPFLTAVSKPIFYKGLLGSGEWQVQSIKRNGQVIERLVLKPVNSGKANLVYKFYPTQALLKTAYKLGEVDLAQELENIDDFQNWPDFKIRENVRFNQLAAIIFNTGDGILSQISTRQALAYALEKNWSNRAFGPISPQSWAYNPNLKRYDFDLEKARDLLKKGIGEEEVSKIKIELSVFPPLFTLAEEIVENWQALGLETEIKTVQVIPQEFQALLVIEDLPPDPDQYLLWHSTQPSNLSRFRSPQVDKLLEDGRKTLDPLKRREFYFDFQRFLVEDAPIVFLYHPNTYTIGSAIY